MRFSMGSRFVHWPASAEGPRRIVRMGCLLGLAGWGLLGLSGCATGARSPAAQPVLYPNAHFNQMGEAQAKAQAQQCIARAQQAGLNPEDQNNSVAAGAARGAATAGVAAAVGTLIGGRNIEAAARHGAQAAAVGGSAGAVSGAFDQRANPTYRHFVERCLSEHGLDVIGWN